MVLRSIGEWMKLLTRFLACWSITFSCRDRSSSDRSVSPEKSRKHSRSRREDRYEDGGKEKKRKSKSKHGKKSDRKKSKRKSGEDREHRRSRRKDDEGAGASQKSGDEGSSSDDNEVSDAIHMYVCHRWVIVVESFNLFGNVEESQFFPIRSASCRVPSLCSMLKKPFD